jgi:hypothetical protein
MARQCAGSINREKRSHGDLKREARTRPPAQQEGKFGVGART